MGAGHAPPMTRSALVQEGIHSREAACSTWVTQHCTVMAVRSDPGGPPAGTLAAELSTLRACKPATSESPAVHTGSCASPWVLRRSARVSVKKIHAVAEFDRLCHSPGNRGVLGHK